MPHAPPAQDGAGILSTADVEFDDELNTDNSFLWLVDSQFGQIISSVFSLPRCKIS